MDMISYWQNTTEIYANGSFSVIIGEYNHKNQNKLGGEICIGVYWKEDEESASFPNSRGKTSPVVIEKSLNAGFLQAILFQATKNNQNTEELQKAIRALIV